MFADLIQNANIVTCRMPAERTARRLTARAANAYECLRMPKNARECPRMPTNAHERPRMPTNARERLPSAFRTTNADQRLRMPTNADERPRMPTNVFRNIVRNIDNNC